MNVIFLYAQIKDKLSKEDAFELCRRKGNYYGRKKNAFKNNFGFR